MDEATAELLSRHLDGDLAQDEERALLEQLAAQPELQEELDTMARLRDAVKSFAAQEEPPAELSALLEPLRRSRPPKVGVRPLYRWLGAAAAVVLCAMVTSELLWHEPASTVNEQQFAGVMPQPTSGYFQLKPLPGPDSDDLVGATDHLIASPPPEIELDSPPPVDVIGPLEEPLPDQPVAEPVDVQPAPVAGAPDRNGSNASVRPACAVTLVVDSTTILSQACSADCAAAGRQSVLISIAGGKLTSVRADGVAEPAATGSPCPNMIGLTVSATIADGEHQATLLVQQQ